MIKKNKLNHFPIIAIPSIGTANRNQISIAEQMHINGYCKLASFSQISKKKYEFSLVVHLLNKVEKKYLIELFANIANKLAHEGTKSCYESELQKTLFDLAVWEGIRKGYTKNVIKDLDKKSISMCNPDTINILQAICLKNIDCNRIAHRNRFFI